MTAQTVPPWVVGLADDDLGAAAVSLAIAELHWTPDVAPAVMDRIARDTVAYPEHFDRRGRLVPAGQPMPAETPTLARTLGRIVVFAVVAALVAVLAYVVATANAAGVEAAGLASLALLTAPVISSETP